MSEDTIVLLAVTLFGVLWGVVQQYRVMKLQEDKSDKKALWTRIDEHNEKLNMFEDEVRRDYWTASEVREYFHLANQPMQVEFKHINEKLDLLIEASKPKPD